MNKSYLIRKIIVYAIYIMLIAAFQVSFPQFLSMFGQVADLMFVFVVVVGYFYGFKDGIVVGLIVGLLRDFYATPSVLMPDGTVSTLVGIGVLVMFLAAVIGSSFFTERMNRNFLFVFLAVAFTTVIYKLVGHLSIYVWYSFSSETSYNLSFSQIMLGSLLPQLLLNIIAVLPISLLMRYLGPYHKGVNPVLIDEKKGISPWMTI